MDITHVSEEQPDSDSISSEQLEALHRILFQTDIKSAKMVCKGCGHIYRIRDGIPNMLLGEDEI